MASAKPIVSRILRGGGLTLALLAVIGAIATWRFGSISHAVSYATGQRIAVERPVQSLGLVEPGSTHRVSFRLTNLSRRPITILGARTSCACTVMANLPIVMGGGTSRNIEAEVHMPDSGSRTFQSIRLFTSVPDSEPIQLGFTAELRSTVDSSVVTR